MKILIDIGHPADFHLFKNFAEQMILKNHSVLFTCRNKDILIDLIQNSEFNYISFGSNFHSVTGKLFGIFLFNFKLLVAAIRFKPDIFLSHGSIYAAQVAFILRKKCITLEDTGNKEQIRLYRAFTNVILTPSCLKNQIGKKQIPINSYHELAYLLPKYFKPDINISKSLILKNDEKIILIRFVAWNASHDVGLKGISVKKKIEIVKTLEKFGRVFISSEISLPKEIEKYRLNLTFHQIHHLMAYAYLVIGESATMASEAAALGIPSIYIDPKGRDYTNELEEKYKLVNNFLNDNKEINDAILKASEILSNSNSCELYKQRQTNMLNDKINLTDFIIWFVENFPKSKFVLKTNPDFQNKFLS